MTAGRLAAASVVGVFAAVAASSLLRPPPVARLPASSRAVIDMRGASVPVALPFARAAVLFPPSIDDFLVGTDRPSALGAAQALNEEPLRNGLMGRMFPAASGTTTFIPGQVGRAPDLETLLRLRPSAVFSRGEDAPRLRRLGLPALGIENTQDERWLRDRARLYLQAEGQGARWAALVADERHGMADVAAAAAGAGGPTPRVLLLASFGRTLIGYGGTDAIAGPLRLAGGSAALGPVLDEHLDRERLLRLDPDVIVLLNTWPQRLARARLVSDPALRTLRAVGTRRVYRVIPGIEFLPDGLASWPLLARWFAELLHPGLPPRLRTQTRDTYRRWTGYTMTDADLDEALAVADNRDAANGARFERH